MTYVPASYRTDQDREDAAADRQADMEAAALHRLGLVLCQDLSDTHPALREAVELGAEEGSELADLIVAAGGGVDGAARRQLPPGPWVAATTCTHKVCAAGTHYSALDLIKQTLTIDLREPECLVDELRALIRALIAALEVSP
jgi:hypothetical protein